VVVALAVAGAGIALASKTFSRNVSSRPEHVRTPVSYPTPLPISILIEGTLVPVPPETLGFDPTDHGALVIRAIPPEQHLFYGDKVADPVTAAGQAAAILAYYKTGMPPLGWTLEDSDAFPDANLQEIGYPSGTTGTRQTWALSDGTTAEIEVVSQNQWTDQWGSTVRISVWTPE
jgi:hypothetical protein